MNVSGRLSDGLIRWTGKYDNISFRIKTPSLDISLQHKNEASCEFSKKKKKNFCTLPILGLALKGLIWIIIIFFFHSLW